jgi:salicylate hydroxylase
MQGQVVHRAELLKALLKPVSGKAMQTSKKVTRITEDADGGGVTLEFTDGTQVTADAVIGADGIHGFVRGYVLGNEHPAVKAQFAGFWDCRTLVPIQTAREALGEEYFEEQRQYAWSGDGGFIMHDVLDRGETVQ